MQAVSRSTVQAFYEAYVSVDPDRVEPFLDDDVDWTISGPVDVLAFCGQHRGKAAVLKLFDQVFPGVFEEAGFEPQSLLVDGDRAALLFVLTGVAREHKRKVSYRVAHFMRFRDDKIIEFRSLIDSFDAAEQVLGHALDLSHHETASDLTAAGDLIAI